MKYYNNGGIATGEQAPVNQQQGENSPLATYAGPYVTEMLGRGMALASSPYLAFMGPLSAGASPLQAQAFSGLGSLGIPTATTGGSFTGTAYDITSGAPVASDSPVSPVQQYMNPYIEAALRPQYEAATREAEIARTGVQSEYGKAGAYGGSRQAVAEAELARGLQDRLADITGKGYAQAYREAADLFTGERDYGLKALESIARAGRTQRDIEGEGIAADIGQFREERDFPYKQVQYLQSLLQNVPIESSTYSYFEPSGLAALTGGFNTGSGIYDLLANLFGQNANTTDSEEAVS